MKILFVYANIRSGNGPHFTPGPASISAVLKRAGHETALLWIQEEPAREDFLGEIRRHSPDVVGFTTFTGQWTHIRRLTAWIRESLPVPVIHGGFHATVDRDNAIACPEVDLLCVGEGEYPMLELVERLARGEPYDDVRNLWIKKPDGTVIRNPLRPLIQDLDALPFMDRDLVPSPWLRRQGPLEGSILMAGRGCPFNCTYCINNALHRLYRGLGRYVRLRSPERVVEEAEFMRDVHGFRNLFIYDDTFTYHHPWLKRFCGLYRERVGLPFIVNVRVETVNPEVLGWLKHAGCRMFIAGIESGSERIRREVLRRGMSNDRIAEAFRAADALGIQTWTNNMIGMPTETPEDAEATIALNKRIRPNRAQIMVFYPFPGTALHSLCQAEGYLSGREQSSLFAEGSVLNLPGFSQDRLQELQARFWRELLEVKIEKERAGLYDLLCLYPGAGVETSQPGYADRVGVGVEGDEAAGIFAHPETRITYDLDLPEGAWFHARIGLSPEVWSPDKGRGVDFLLELEQAGEVRTVFSRYVDPKHREEDRRWLPVHLPLPVSGPVKLRLVTTVKDRPDYFCWAFWIKPFINTASAPGPDFPGAGRQFPEEEA